MRRSITDRADLTHYVCFNHTDVPLAELVRVAGHGWISEDALQEARQEVGLDQYEARQWTSWYRHITLALLAHAFLAVTRYYAIVGDAKGVSISEVGPLRKSARLRWYHRRAGVRPVTNQLSQKKRHDRAAQYAPASAMACSELMAVTLAGDAGPPGPTPWPSLRTIFSTWWASAAMYPSHSTFHSPRTGTGPIPDGPAMRRFLPRWSDAGDVPAGMPQYGFLPWLSDRRSDTS